ncbi:MAG: MFS transporter [bacterium]
MADNPLGLPCENMPITHDQQMWRWRILISTYFAYCGYYLCRKVFTLCKTTLADEFDVGLDKIAHIWTAYLIAYMIGQFVNSFIGRKWGPRVLLLGGLGISLVINIIFGFANSYWTFLSFMFFNGLVQASGWPGCVGTVAEWLRRCERGTFMGVWNTNFIVANIAVKSIGGFLLASYGWRYAFFGCTLVAFAVWWLIYFWQRNRPGDVGLEPVVEKDDDEYRSVQASTESRITFKQYSQLLMNPIIPFMGLSYFFIKFLRYALDSWLPAFLNLQGLDVGRAAYYSQIFDFAGIAGAIAAGWMLDRWFKGKWAVICFVMGIGMIFGYVAVVKFGANPYALAFCYGIVGFMLYGPDSLLCGAGAIQVAGVRNAPAVAGLVNGIGSFGPVIQEEVIGFLMRADDPLVGIRNANLLTLVMSIAFALFILIVTWQVQAANRKREKG